MDQDKSSIWFEVLTLALNRTMEEESLQARDKYSVEFRRLQRAVLNTVDELQTMAQWFDGSGVGNYPTSVSLSRHAIWAEYCVQHLEAAKGTDSLPDAVDYTTALLKAFSQTQRILDNARDYITNGHLVNRAEFTRPSNTATINEFKSWLLHSSHD